MRREGAPYKAVVAAERLRCPLQDGLCRDAAGCARGSSRPWYAPNVRSAFTAERQNVYGVGMSEADTSIQGAAGPNPQAKSCVPDTPPTLVAFRERGNVLTIEGFPGWLPWKIGVRFVAAVGVTVWVVT